MQSLDMISMNKDPVPLMQKKHNIHWLVVLTILKYISSSMGRMTSHIKQNSCLKLPTSNMIQYPRFRQGGKVISANIWTIDLGKLPSGKRLQCANLKIAIEIVDLPIANCDFPLFFVCLPEGTFPSAHPQQKNEWITYSPPHK